MARFDNKNIFLMPFKTLALAMCILCLSASYAAAANINVLCSTALTGPLMTLVPEFEQATGHKVTIDFKITKNIVELVRGGQRPDLIIVGNEAAADLEKEGKLVPNSRIDIGSTSVGIAVRNGAPKPDISSVDAFKQSLLSAKAIAVSKSGLSGVHFMRTVEKLGITNEMRPKLKLLEGSGRTADFVASGEADVAVQLISELIGVEGTEVVGPFPPGVDNTIILTSGVSVDAKEPAGASALVSFLRSPSIKVKMKKTGINPM